MEVSIRVFIDLFEKGLIFCAVVTNNWKVKKKCKEIFFSISYNLLLRKKLAECVRR